MSRRRRRVVVIAAVVIAVAAVALGLMFRAAGRSDPVSVADVLARFRAADTSTGTGAPAPGVYRYRVVGSESGGAGPLRVHRDLPPEATVTVLRTGDREWETETAFSRQHVEGARLRVVGDAVRMVWRREDVTFAGLGRDDRRDIEGRYRIAPLDPVPGTTFVDRYVTGTLRNTVRTTIGRRQTLIVGGTPVPTVVIHSTTETEGALSGTRDETMWWSPELRVPVRVRQRVAIDGVVGYDSDIAMRLVALSPAT